VTVAAIVGRAAWGTSAVVVKKTAPSSAKPWALAAMDFVIVTRAMAFGFGNPPRSMVPSLFTRSSLGNGAS
jgi:hypothetical protein